MVDNIISMTKAELLKLHPWDLMSGSCVETMRPLRVEEIFHIYKTMGALWRYDYLSLNLGSPGLHIELDSGLHSDGFFIPGIILKPLNLRMIMAIQMVLKFRGLGENNYFARKRPYFVGGVPHKDGTTELSRLMALVLKSQHFEFKKYPTGEFILPNNIIVHPLLNIRIILVEELCTSGTFFRETATLIRSQRFRGRTIEILPWEMVIINCSGLSKIIVEGVGNFEIVALAEYKINEWEPKDCPLCRLGSITINPKVAEIIGLLKSS